MAGKTTYERPAILVVEDDRDVLSLLEEWLTEGGYDVTSSPNSLSAFEQIQAGTSFSLVVTDVGMPGAADGRELARFIMNTRPHIPIIVISGSGFSANDELEGRVVFLMKPFDPEALLATVAKALSAPPPKLAQTR